MPIKNEINQEQHCIYTMCSGLILPNDIDEYLARIWTDLSNYGYNEFFDATQADWREFDFKYLFEVAQQASKLTAIDNNSKLAWYVATAEDKEKADYYVSAKLLITDESRIIKAFFDRNEALDWLGIEH